MTKLQFWTLNLVSLLLILLLLGHFFYSRQTSRLNQLAAQERIAIHESQQLESTLDLLARRIAMGSETDPRLRDLLLKYGLTVTLEVNGRKKSYP